MLPKEITPRGREPGKIDAKDAQIRGLRSLILGNLGILAHFRHFYWPQGIRIATLSGHQNMFYNKLPGHNTRRNEV